MNKYPFLLKMRKGKVYTEFHKQNFHLGHQKLSALRNHVFNITHIGDLVWAGESDRTPFMNRTEYYNLS